MAERIGTILVAAAMLVGCGTDPNMGGGTELPSPIQVYVVKTPDSNNDTDKTPSGISARVLARQWRLWDVVSQAWDSTTLESRGLLVDSAGIVTLPPDSGTYLVEAWTVTPPPESLDVRLRVATASLPLADSCLNRISSQSAPNGIRSCPSGSTPAPRITAAPPHAPDVYAMVRIAGTPRHQFRLLGIQNDTLPLGEARLWWNADTAVFKGILKPGGTLAHELPSLHAMERFVIEGWNHSGTAPNRIASHVARKIPDSVYDRCVIRPAAPLPDVLTLYSCDLAPLNLSGGSVAPDHWAIVEYWE